MGKKKKKGRFLRTDLSFRLSFLYLSRLSGSGSDFLSFTHTNTRARARTHARSPPSLRGVLPSSFLSTGLRDEAALRRDPHGLTGEVKAFRAFVWR